MNYKQRVLMELLELNKKINLLIDKINRSCSEDKEVVLEKRQLAIMEKYKNILIDRLLYLLED